MSVSRQKDKRKTVVNKRACAGKGLNHFLLVKAFALEVKSAQAWGCFEVRDASVGWSGLSNFPTSFP